MLTRKNVAIISNNIEQLHKDIDSSLQNMYYFFNFENEAHPISLIIIDGAYGMNIFNNYKSLGLISKTVACVYIEHIDTNHVIQDLKVFDHMGIVICYKKIFDNYQNISSSLQKALQPNMPVKVSKVQFVIPVYNENARLQYVSNFIKKLMEIIESQNLDAKIKLVDDGSTDNSVQYLTEFIKSIHENEQSLQIDNYIEILPLLKNTKKSGVYKAAIANQDANYYFFLDSDDSFFKEDIVKALNIMKDGYYDIIQATKDTTAEGRSPARKVLSYFKRMLTKPFLPVGIYDSQTGFRILSSAFATHAIPHIKEEYEFASDLQLLNICKNLRFRALQLSVKCIDREGSHVDPVSDSKKFLKSILKIALRKESYHDAA